MSSALSSSCLLGHAFLNMFLRSLCDTHDKVCKLLCVLVFLTFHTLCCYLAACEYTVRCARPQDSGTKTIVSIVHLSISSPVIGEGHVTSKSNHEDSMKSSIYIGSIMKGCISCNIPKNRFHVMFCNRKIDANFTKLMGGFTNRKADLNFTFRYYHG